MDRPFPVFTAQFRSVLFAFIAIDICFILIHFSGWALFRLGWTGEISHAFRISDDRSIPESFNYVKWAILVIALTWIAIRDRWVIAVAWAAVFLLMLLDDSLGIHESFGLLIADYLPLADESALDAGDVGELIYAVMMGGLVAFLAGWALLRSDAKSRRLTLTYLLVIGAFGFFSVVVDAIQRVAINAFPELPLLQDLFALIEEGGEMAVASTAAALTLAPPGWISTSTEAPPAVAYG